MIALPVLECQGDNIAVVVHVDHGIALGLDSHILIVSVQMEAGVPFGDAVDDGAVVVAGSPVGHAFGCLADVAVEGDRFCKIICFCTICNTISISYPLLPDNDRVVGFIGFLPLGVDRCVNSDLTAKGKFSSGGVARIGVPAVEGVT